MKQVKNMVCLWFNGDAEEAAQFYARTFPESSVDAIHRAPADYPAGKEGDVIMVSFTVLGIPCVGLNGGPGVPHGQAFSFLVTTADQEETDRYWNAIVSMAAKSWPADGVRTGGESRGRLSRRRCWTRSRDRIARRRNGCLRRCRR